MKLPNFDEALKKLDKFDDLQPVLEEMRDSLNTLVQIQSQILDIQATHWGFHEYGSHTQELD